MKTFAVAWDLLVEARSRRWFLALGGGITLVLLLLAAGLRVEVVDGALAATRLFGSVLDTDIRSADLALRPVYRATAYVVTYGGLLFGIVACADFAPSLLSPGRVEHLLALPVRRAELLTGTFLGVLGLAVLGSLYGAGGLTLILSLKTGAWTFRPILAGLLASVAFAAIYGVMLVTAVQVRSTVLSAAAGIALFALGIVAGFREDLRELFDEGVGRTAFDVATLLLPRVSTVAKLAADLASSAPVDGARLATTLLGVVVFAGAALAFALARFEGKDY